VGAGGATLTVGSVAVVVGSATVGAGVAVGSSGGGGDGVFAGESGASVGTARPPVVGRVVDTTVVVVSRGSELLSLEQANVRRVATMETVSAATNQREPTIATVPTANPAGNGPKVTAGGRSTILLPPYWAG
jgi:hypothetical protein